MGTPMHVTDGLNCGNCPHYEATAGHCRAHPRMYDAETGWAFPYVAQDDLCGEHPQLATRLRVLNQIAFMRDMQANVGPNIAVPGGFAP